MDNELEILRCSYCNRPLGIITEMQGVEVLKVGAFYLRAAHGTCQCGAGIHWDMGERALSRLVSHVLAQRRNDGI